MTRSSSLAVERFRQILIWPLAMARSDKRVSIPGTAISRQAEKLKGSAWTEITDGLEHLHLGKKEDDTEKFQEFVYFHDFVARFLYAKQTMDKTNLALRIFSRKDVRLVSVNLSNNTCEELCVDRLRLYLFDVGVAALVVEVFAENMNLDRVMLLSDELRRAYPPYWIDSKPGGFPALVKWQSDREIESGRGSIGNHGGKQEYIDHVKNSRHAPIAPHWLALIKPLQVEGYDGENKGKQAENDVPVWRHVVDERIPIMTYIGVSKIKEISRKDWIRLCFVDSPGDGMPYAETFMEDFESDHAYDRFWDPDNGLTARYMCAGYSMIMATSNDCYARKHLETHFRRHYFQMGLVVHMQVSALLALSDHLSRAVADYESQADGLEDFEDRIAELHRELLRFTHRYWFTGVSNQVQGQELYDLWRERLNVQALYEEVANEAREADQFLTLKRQDRIADDNKRLTELAAVGLPLALAVGFLGMNLVVGRSGEWTDWTSSAQWEQVFVVLGAFTIVGGVLTELFYRRGTPSHSKPLSRLTRLPKPTGVLLIAGALCLLGALCLSIFEW